MTRILRAEKERDELGVASVGKNVHQPSVHIFFVDGLEVHAEASVWLNDSSHASARASRKELPDGRRSITLSFREGAVVPAERRLVSTVTKSLFESENE